MNFYRRMTKAARAGMALLVVALAIVALPAYGSSPAPGCQKLEGSNIGREGVTLALDGIQVTFDNWKAKDTGEFIGFDFQANGYVVLTVKAGRERFSTNPAMSGGYSVPPVGTAPIKAISYVEACIGQAPADPPAPPAGD